MVENNTGANNVDGPVQIERQAESLINYEVSRGQRAKLWLLSSYSEGEGDDYWFYDKLLDTFSGVTSMDDALRQSKLIKIIARVSEKVVDSEGVTDEKEWAARLHGACVMSEALHRIMPDTIDTQKRLNGLVAIPLESGKTLLEELLSIDVDEVSTQSEKTKIDIFKGFLEEIVDKLNRSPRESYYHSKPNLDKTR